MSNLDIEGLSKIVQTGDVERMFGGAGGPGQVASETRVADEMKAQGLAPAPAGDAGKTFSDVLRQSVDQVNTYQHQADTAIKELVAGRTKNIHETMLAVERADTSLKLMMQVRNKILDAYREIMRMQV
jgi:flagellar hook-basal body complex protein FliE